MSALRIACTAINKRIMAGKIGKNNFDFIGTPIDVTSDVMKAIIDKIGVGKTDVITINGVPTYEIEVRQIDLPAISATPGVK